MNLNPLVSVVIPCYNHEKYVQDTIQSIINQTYENIELIIIDDGSKDDSVIKIQKMISQCKKRFTRFEFRCRLNKGLSTTLNEALEWCKGKYFSAIASDDLLIETKIAIQVDFLEKNKKIVGIFGGVELIDENNQKLETLPGTNLSYSFEKIILHQHVIYTPTQLVRLDPLKKLGGYKNGMIIEDWYMWLKLSQEGEMHCASEIFCKYRQHDSNISKKHNIMYEGRKQVLNEFKNSIFYKYAMIDIKWMYILDLESNIFNKLKFSLAHPIWFFSKIKKRYLEG